MIIEVKHRHIKAGISGDFCKCPVALAVAEALGRDRVEVSQYGIDVLRLSETGVIGTVEHYDAPRSVTRFVQAFDTGNKKPKPFRFRLVGK